MQDRYSGGSSGGGPMPGPQAPVGHSGYGGPPPGVGPLPPPRATGPAGAPPHTFGPAGPPYPPQRGGAARTVLWVVLASVLILGLGAGTLFFLAKRSEKAEAAQGNYQKPLLDACPGRRTDHLVRAAGST
jgi:hypothetical protein